MSHLLFLCGCILGLANLLIQPNYASDLKAFLSRKEIWDTVAQKFLHYFKYIYIFKDADFIICILFYCKNF